MKDRSPPRFGEGWSRQRTPRPPSRSGKGEKKQALIRSREGMKDDCPPRFGEGWGEGWSRHRTPRPPSLRGKGEKTHSLPQFGRDRHEALPPRPPPSLRQRVRRRRARGALRRRG